MCHLVQHSKSGPSLSIPLYLAMLKRLCPASISRPRHPFMTFSWAVESNVFHSFTSFLLVNVTSLSRTLFASVDFYLHSTVSPPVLEDTCLIFLLVPNSPCKLQFLQNLVAPNLTCFILSQHFNFTVRQNHMELPFCRSKIVEYRRFHMVQLTVCVVHWNRKFSSWKFYVCAVFSMQPPLAS